ncbi:MAG: hypothetical protein ABL879_18235 [Devosia sp.]
MIRLFSPLNLVLIAVGAVVTLAGFLLVPINADLPVRWGFDLRPVLFMPRNLALVQMPLAGAAVWLVFWAIRRWGNPERQAHSAVAMNIALPAVTGVLILAQVAIVLSGWAQRAG